MKNILKHIAYSFLAFAVCASCMKDLKSGDFEKEAISATIKIKVEMPPEHEGTADNMKVLFIDPSSGLRYEAITDQEGVAAVDVAYGTYTASTEKKVKKAGMLDIYNGTTEKLRVTPKDPKIISTTLTLNYSRSGQLVIKELYYSGCWNDLTNKAYTGKDAYFSIYNNSDETAYLDSVCIGIINPLNAPTKGKVPDWVKPGTTELRDSLACGTMVWMFPGTGNDLPLEPGKEVICCLNAIDHTASVPASVNLGKQGYYALYDSKVTTVQSVPNAGVNRMELIWRTGTTKAFALSVQSPGLVLFTLGGKNIQQYIKDNQVFNPRFPANPSFDCLMVDKNLVLDGVECFKSITDSKRIRPEVDNGFAITAGLGKGQSVIRKIDAQATAAAGGRIVYMDTNNSTNDFQAREYACLTGK